MAKDWKQILIRLDNTNAREMELLKVFEELTRMTGSARKTLLILLKGYVRDSNGK